MKMTRRSAVLTLCALLLAANRPSGIAQSRVDAETIGVPWGGAVGIERTTAEIMAEQAFAPERSAPEVDQIRTERTNAPQAVSTAFTGATFADTGAFPPDTMGAAGPTQFVVFVTGRLRTFDKTTGVADGVLNIDPDVFFNSVKTVPPGGGINFTIYPQVRYDRLTARWILTIVDVPSSTPANIGDIPNRVLIAVSDAASAGLITGATVWTFYFVQQDTVGGGPSTGEFLDYPSLGVDANALYIGGDMFGTVSPVFLKSTGFVVRKSSILSGGPIVVTAFRGIVPNNVSDGPLSPRGVDNYDPASNEGYFIGVSAAVLGRLNLRRISDPGGTPGYLRRHSRDRPGHVVSDHRRSPRRHGRHERQRHRAGRSPLRRAHPERQIVDGTQHRG